MLYITNYSSSLGDIVLSSDGESLLGLKFVSNEDCNMGSSLEIFKYTFSWLDKYFLGKNPNKYEAPIKLQGSPFRLKVWENLCKIEYGETKTYGQIAKEIEKQTGKRVSAQAVGGAVGANPILLIVPCHRVLSQNGKLTGYSAGIDRKEKLLQIENTLKYEKTIKIC